MTLTVRDAVDPLDMNLRFPLRVFHYPIRSWAGLAQAVRSGREKALLRDPILRRMSQQAPLSHLRVEVMSNGPRPPEPRQKLIESLLGDGSLVRDRRVRERVISPSKGSNGGSDGAAAAERQAEEIEVAALVIAALSREDRYLRGYANSLEQQLGEIRSSLWWRLCARLARALPRFVPVNR